MVWLYTCYTCGDLYQHIKEIYLRSFGPYEFLKSRIVSSFFRKDAMELFISFMGEEFSNSLRGQHLYPIEFKSLSSIYRRNP